MSLPKHLQNVTLQQVEDSWRQGTTSSDDYEHYCYHWRNIGFKYSSEKQAYEATFCPICGELFPEKVNYA